MKSYQGHSASLNLFLCGNAVLAWRRQRERPLTHLLLFHHQHQRMTTHGSAAWNGLHIFQQHRLVQSENLGLGGLGGSGRDGGRGCEGGGGRGDPTQLSWGGPGRL